MTRASSTVVELKPVPSTAEAWCARLNADDVTETDRHAFEAWLATSPDHRAEYEVSALANALSRSLPDTPDLLQQLRSTSRLDETFFQSESQQRFELMDSLFSTKSRFDPAGVRSTKQRAWRISAIAASVCLISIAAGFLAWHMSSTQYTTDIGEQKLVALTDGSTVQLNTASAIGVDLEQAERHVTLRHGEAFFNVAKDPTRPFIVRAGSSEIRVVGTKFNVRMDGDTAYVTVIEGKVKVSKADGETQLTAPTPIDLLPGQSANIATAQPVVKLPEVNTAKLTAWREGRIYFEHEPLSKVIAEVNRYSETQFVIPDTNTRSLTLSGVFRTGDTDSVAFALRETYHLQTQHDGNRILVKPAN